MSVIRFIAGIPLFTTVQDALNWASANGLTGFHTHVSQGQTGYMGGANHQQATGSPSINTTPTITTNPTTGGSSGSSGGGGGGGGY